MNLTPEEMGERIDALESFNSKLRMERDHWKSACLYRNAIDTRDKPAPYQSLFRNPTKVLRHLPTYHDTRRATKLRGEDYGVNPERVYLTHWRSENRRVSGLNGGRGTLEILLSEDGNYHTAKVFQRDAMVAATVIQWLGTACGRGFVTECENAIKKLTDVARAKQAEEIKNIAAAEVLIHGR